MNSHSYAILSTQPAIHKEDYFMLTLHDQSVERRTLDREVASLNVMATLSKIGEFCLLTLLLSFK